MSRDEVVDLIGTIAKSGTAEMLAQAAAGPGGRRRVGGGDRRADRPVRRRLLLQLHGRRPGRRWSPARPASTRGRPLGVDRRGHLHRRRGAGRPAGHRGHPAPQARGHRGRLHDYTEPGDGPGIVKRYSDFITWPIRMAPRRPTRTRTRRPASRRSSTPARRCGPAPQSEVSDEEYTEFYRHVSHDWQRAAGDHPAGGRGHLRVPGAAVPAQPRADGPVHARRQARRAALRQARVHHGRLRGAGPRVPALRQGRRRRERPVAQHLPRDPAAGPADPADPQAPGAEGALDGQDDAGEGAGEVRDVLVRVRPGRQGGPALRPRQPGGDPGDLLVRRRPTTRRSRPRCATTSRGCRRARTRSTTPPASRGRRWRTRRTWRRSGPRATRCCC